MPHGSLQPFSNPPLPSFSALKPSTCSPRPRFCIFQEVTSVVTTVAQPVESDFLQSARCFWESLASCLYQEFLPFNLQAAVHRRERTQLFIHSPVDRRGSSLRGALDDAYSCCERLCAGSLHFISFRRIHRCGTAGSNLEGTSNLMKDVQSAFPHGCIISNPRSGSRVPVAPRCRSMFTVPNIDVQFFQHWGFFLKRMFFLPCSVNKRFQEQRLREE